MLNNTNYGYLFCPKIQIVDLNGKPMSNAFLNVFIAGTSTAVTTYSDWDETANPIDIQLDLRGECTVIASNEQLYKVILLDDTHDISNPIWTCDNVPAISSGGSTISSIVVNNGDANISVTSSSIGGVLHYFVSASDSLLQRLNGIDTSLLAAKTEISNNSNIDVSSTIGSNGQTIYSLNQNRVVLNYASPIVISQTTSGYTTTYTIKLDSSFSSDTYMVKASSSDVTPDYLNNKVSSSDERLVVTKNSNGLVFSLTNLPTVDIVSSDSSLDVTSSIEGSTKTFDLKINSSNEAKNYLIFRGDFDSIPISSSTVLKSSSTTLNDTDMTYSEGILTVPIGVSLLDYDLRLENYFYFNLRGVLLSGITLEVYVDGTVNSNYTLSELLETGEPTQSSSSYNPQVSNVINLRIPLRFSDTTVTHQVYIKITNNNSQTGYYFKGNYRLFAHDISNINISSSSGGTSDHKVSVDGTDEAGYLYDKVTSSDGSLQITKTTGSAKTNFTAKYPGAGSIVMSESLPLSSCTTFNQYSNTIVGSSYVEIFNVVQPFGNLKLTSGSSLIRAMRQYNAWDYARATIYHWNKTNSCFDLVAYSNLYSSYVKTGILEVPLTTIKDSDHNIVDSFILNGGDYYYVGMIIKSYTLCPLLGSTITSPYYVMPKLTLAINSESSIINNSTDVIPLDEVSYATTTETDNTSVAWVQLLA